MVDVEYIRKRFIDGEYAISDHAIIEARKKGLNHAFDQGKKMP